MKICMECALQLKLDEQQHLRPGDDESCFICLGLRESSFRTRLSDTILAALEPYGGPEANRFSRERTLPSIILPGDILHRYSVASQNKAYETTPLEFVNEIKKGARDALSRVIDDINSQGGDFSQYPDFIRDEEQGHLCVYVMVTPKAGVHRPEHLMPGPKKVNRKRRINDETQGGDPRMNLESKLINKGKVIWTINQALEHKSIHFGKESAYETVTPSYALDIDVALWRSPFYLRGYYTKSRRDVSQTPFFVVDNGIRQKLGVTSVEEQILPVVSKYCGGISKRNNDPLSSHVIFGMAKFHASGREDMDVRMLLPHKNALNGSVGISGGRPFVCEIIDALRLPQFDDLKSIVQEINHITPCDPINEPGQRWYGQNPTGVGISDQFFFAITSSFSTLQAETESKTKFYGCLCWSENQLPDDNDILTKSLGLFPLEILQRTPIRVLHRRSNLVRRRRILTCKAERIDDHYFRLHLSTDAGAYVKEFVHGDLGRTVPSIASLLNSKTDILELDCDGILTN